MDKMQRDIDKYTKIINETLTMSTDGKLDLLEYTTVILAITDFAKKMEPIWERHNISYKADF